MKEITKYVSEEGKEFISKEACLRYEAVGRLDKHISNLISVTSKGIAEAIFDNREEFIAYLNSLGEK